MKRKLKGEKFETGFSGSYVEKERMIASIYQSIFELRKRLGTSRAHRKFTWKLEVHQV